MSIVQLLKLLLRNWKMLLLVPLVLGISVYYFTRNQKKVFLSETVVYTGIASGYSINGNNSADFFQTSNAFDNLLTIINSRETKEEVAISLLSSHLYLSKHDPNLLGWDAFAEIHELVPENIRRQLIKPGLEATRDAVATYMKTSENNLVYNIINSDNPYYSIKALQGIQALRINSSDLIKVSYETNDAAICKNTLELLVDIFMKKHRLLREGQTGSVIAFFEREVKAAFNRLDSCEQIFLDFNKKNEIINYYEQTKAVAGEKENLYALNHNLEMERNANAKAVDKVNNDLKGRNYQDIYGRNVIQEREKLADLYSKISLNNVFSRGGEDNQRRMIDSLQRATGPLEQNLQKSISNLSTQLNTPKGIPVKSVLDEWVKSTLNFEESKARLTIMDKRKKEFTEEYRKFAPLGAMLKKIERQIGVAEQEYLELLHGLSLARLTQQNNELTSKLTIVDPPYLPLKPNASKRMLLVIVGAFAGFVIVLGTLLANFLMNRTLQQPDKAFKKIGIPLLGIYPVINNNDNFLRKATLRIMQQLLSKLSIDKTPVVIGVISNQSGEGKSILIESWKKEMSILNYNVQAIKWSQGSYVNIDEKAHVVFIEIPPLENIVLTKQSLPALHKTIIVCRANRIWTKIDTDLLDIYSKTTETKPLLVLNGVSVDNAEEFIGEVPKKRSFMRSLIKKLAKLEFGNQKSLYRA